MATKKKLLQAAAGTAAASGGAGGLNVEQVFSTYLYEGNGGGHIIDNGINLGQSNSGGGIYFPDGDGDYLQTATLPALSGEFTIELWFFSYDADRAIYLIGNGTNENNFMVKTDYLTTSGNVYITVSGTSVGGNASSHLDVDGWNHIVVTRNSSNLVSSYVNGQRIGTATISGSLNSTTYNIGTVGGGTASASGYELMYGYISSVRISDTARYDPTLTYFTVPTSAFTSDSNTVLLLGQGDTPLADASSNSYSVTANGIPSASEVGPFDAADAGEGGMVWIKSRDQNPGTGWYHLLFDTERGVNNVYFTNSTDPNQGTTYGGVSSFNATGFTIQQGTNTNSGPWGNHNGVDYTSWTFRKAPKFFDMVYATGTSAGGNTVSHNLGTTPGFMVAKSLGANSEWYTWHKDIPNNALRLNKANDTSAVTSPEFVWGNGSSIVQPTDTELTFYSSGGDYVIYLFADNDGDGGFGDGTQDIIKCGSYAGNGAANTNVIDLGFEPQWVIIKNISSSSGNWNIFDNMRGITTGGSDPYLASNTDAVEGTTLNIIDLHANGFTPSTSAAYVNASGSNYIYIAIRRGPMAVPTDATDVFAVDNTQVTTAPNFTSGFPVDFAFMKTTSGSDTNVMTRLMQGTLLRANLSNAEVTNALATFDYMDGHASWTNAPGRVSHMWKRAPNFFDVVAYTGNGTAGRTVSHNLGVAPEMMWVKRRDSAQDWKVYHTGLTSASYYLDLNGSAAEVTSSVWAGTDPTDAVFSVGSNASVNASSGTYIAYLFASLDGVSKVGSFTHTAGTNTTVDCGFSGGARFVIIKRISGAGQWNVLDTERGLVAGNDAWLNINTTDAEDSSYDFIDPSSSGFTVDGSGVLSSATYIFYAIA